MDILIIGAGPTGLTTALELVRQGLNPTIVDAKDKPSELSRAVGILPNSIDILRKTDVGDRLLEAGVDIQRVELSRDGRHLLALDVSALNKSEFIVSLPQDETETIMSELLAKMGVDVQYDCKVVSVQTKNDTATATFASGESKDCDWIVGADGINSDVRQSLDIPYEGYDLAEEWSIADLKVDPTSYDMQKVSAWMLVGDRQGGDAMVLFPVTDSRVRLVSSTPDSTENLPIDLHIKEVQHAGTFTISVRQAKQYFKGSVLLAGDAAHAHSPVGGRGMNLGIADGEAVAKTITQNNPHEYETRRRKKAQQVINYTKRARRVVKSDNRLLDIGLHTAGWIIETFHYPRSKMIEKLVQL